MSMRRNLLTTAAAAALVGAMSSGAMAFDTTTWNWTNTVTTTFIFSNANVAVNALVELEKLQVHMGDTLDASATGNSINLGGLSGLSIDNSATAAANSQSVISDVAVFLDDVQIGIGSTNVGTPLSGLLATLTSNTNRLDISATATLNVAAADTVDNAATAVTNNIGVAQTMAAGTGLVIADISQLSVANLAATASLDTVAPISTGGTFTNTAASVGNNVNIKVNAPTL